ncbi:hypothetical protein [Cellulosimicrobium arenosum]|uniref:hypothetical protein n=1 Tax=Cellulosimicrobium arenosum TaxID=2708133 RepID=UPI00177B0B3F|nr:hypothetical protein [Cellulosimicrobium arenosum]
MRARVLLLLTALVVVVAGVALVVGLARDDGVDDASEGLAVDPARVAELEAAEVAHDAENLTASIEHAQHVQAELVPVLDALHGVLPVDGTTPVAPAAEDVAAWRATLDTLTSETQSLPSGSSEHNIVRNGMLTSVELLGDTVDAVDLARVADASSAPGLYALAGDLRTRAVDTWGLAAVQLDLRATAAGQGHVHVFLPVHPDDALDGGLGTHGEQDDPGTDHDH